jgi:4-hydroxybenzoate polyprenyltransferase
MMSRFIYIIFAIILVLLVSPFLQPIGLFGHFFNTLLIAMIPLSSGFALTGDKKTAIVILLIAAPL